MADTIRRCRDCGEIAGSVTGFGPWCVGDKLREHNPEEVELKTVETAPVVEAIDRIERTAFACDPACRGCQVGLMIRALLTELRGE